MGLNSSSNADFTGFIEDFNRSGNEFFEIKKNKAMSQKIFWKLPCSKSHFIRWLFISSQTRVETKIKFSSKIGNDILSCANVLEKLGVKIQKKETYWKICGCEQGHFNKNPGVLDCGNSATTLRFLSFLIARNGINAKIIGDKSLSGRNFTQLIEILEKGGSEVRCENKHGFLPFNITGRFNIDLVDVFTKNTSQLISGLLVTMPSSVENNRLIIKNEIVSRPYFELTSRICIETGSIIKINNGEIELKPWKPKINDEIIIPGEASLIVFPLLYCKLHNIDVFIENWPNNDDCLGFDIIKEHISHFGLTWNLSNDKILITKEGLDSYLSLDIKDNIDLITPLIILMSLSGGGSLKGILHAKNKESDRIKSTMELCKKFGVKLDLNHDLTVSSSKLFSPRSHLFVNGDHRLQMSAVILLSFTEGFVESAPWYENSDPDFLKRLYINGVSIS